MDVIELLLFIFIYFYYDYMSFFKILCLKLYIKYIDYFPDLYTQLIFDLSKQINNHIYDVFYETKYGNVIIKKYNKLNNKFNTFLFKIFLNIIITPVEFYITKKFNKSCNYQEIKIRNNREIDNFLDNLDD